MDILQETKMIMRKYNLDFKKKFGQNFLISEFILDEIINLAQIDENDIIIEIGPGIGTLTAKLLSKAKHVISIEIDNDLINPLKDRFFMYKNFTLIHEDILKVDLIKEIQKLNISDDKSKVKVVANIPYYITTPIIFALLEKREIIDFVYIMMQKEVSERLRAILGSKEASAFSYYTNYYAEIVEYISVGRYNFMPIPKVDSEVLGLKIRKEPYPKVEDEELYFKLIKLGFLHRRKTFLNSIKMAGGIDILILSEVLDILGIDKMIRPEKLTEQDYANIVKVYKETKEKEKK